MRDEFAQAVEGLYRAFDAYERPRWFGGCACCWESDEAMEGSFTRGTVRVWAPGGDRPLRELTPDELREVANQVPHLGGDVDVLRHYLPRMLEIAVTVRFDCPDIEPLVGRLNYDASLGGSPWWTWRQEERAAITRFFEAVWRYRLGMSIDDGEMTLSADELLCAVGTVIGDVRPYLAKWIALDEAHSAEHLAEFLAVNSDLVTGRMSNPFWDTNHARTVLNIRRVVQWAHSSATLLAVINAASDTRTPHELEAMERTALLLTGANAFGDSVLEAAVEDGDDALVRLLLQRGVNPNEPDQITATPLWVVAFAAGRHQVVAEFAKAGADLDTVDEEGRTMLHRVVSQGPDVDGPRRLIALGASIDVQDRYGWTALHCASAYGYATVVDVLLSAGADTKVATREGKTALDMGVANNHAEVVRVLSEYGGRFS